MTRIVMAWVMSILVMTSLAACTASKPQVATDLNTGLEVAAALEGAYAARAGSDPKVVAELARLMAGAQAAVAAWEASTSPTDEAAANAAIAALVAYEASAHISP